MRNISAVAVKTENLEALFIYYLHKIYDGKLYLKDNLDRVQERTSIKVLKLAIEELCHDANAQLTRMKIVYDILGEKPSTEFDAPMKKMIQDACEYRNNPDIPAVNDIDIMVHMQLVEHVNLVSYRILKKLAVVLGYQEIEKLMAECFDETKDNDKLFLAIAKEYLGA